MASQRAKAKSKPHPIQPWPSEGELKRMRRTLARKPGSEGLPPNASAMDHAKYELCAEFVKYLRTEGITQRELAEQLATSEARVSEIVHYRLAKLTAEQLLRYLERIKPDFRLKVA
jgi:predicted XRE-type DNA-binding protein